MTNRELQDLLKQFPDDMRIGGIEVDPDYPEDWYVQDEVGVCVLHLGYGGTNKNHERVIVIN